MESMNLANRISVYRSKVPVIKVPVMNHEYENLSHKSPCSWLPFIQSRPNRVCEFCLVNTLTSSKFHLYFSRYKLFNYKYVHIIKLHVLHLNYYFFIRVARFVLGLLDVRLNNAPVHRPQV